jgi:uncharacterized OB-fold protein
VNDGLRAPHVMKYAYRRAVGGAARRFLSGLARGEVWGSRTEGGRVLVPASDTDPETGRPTLGDVRVGDAGVVRSWTWVSDPDPDQPLDHPFAYALVQLDGADTALLHLVDQVEEDQLGSGLRVRADWRAQRIGSILDVRAFVPESRPEGGGPSDEESGAEVGDIEVLSGLETHYVYEPGRTASRFLESLSQRRIVGGRCPACGRTYVPARPRCPLCSAGPMIEVELGHRGVVSAYTVVHVPGDGVGDGSPFVTAWIRLDGADVPFPHLLAEVDADSLEIGQVVEAVWVSDSELAPTWESIDHFRPVPTSDQPSDNPTA